MYRIVIFSGGTGSTSIQEGFSDIYGNENYRIDLIINAYDNGKSTGSCRKLFDNRILGPSDLRKNHMIQFRLQHRSTMSDYTSREAILYRIFNTRIDAESKEKYYSDSIRLIKKEADYLASFDIEYLTGLIDYFFFFDGKPNHWRKGLQGISFKDFSIANIFYSSLAAIHDYSLRLAGKEMASFLGIKDNVHLVSGVNLYLNAQTESGELIKDEGDIVEWDNSVDKITSVVLTKDGVEYIPSVDEEIDITKVPSVKSIIEQADIIIFSSGTQWSSLIPTYMHSGIRETLANSKAKKYIVMNNVEDHDMKGVTADEILDIIDRYIPINDLTAVVNKDASPGMNTVTKVKSISGHLGGYKDKHNPIKLISLLMQDFYQISSFDGTFIYDLDGTLWDERGDNKNKTVGTENMNIFTGVIHSGNNYEYVRDVFRYLYHQDQVTHIYSDFGNVHFTSNDYTIDILSESYVIENEVVDSLEEVREFKRKIKVRGVGCVVTIKPLINRDVMLNKALDALKKFNGKYVAYISGHTSIDIMHKDYNKKTMLFLIMNSLRIAKENVIFVGNETEKGSEEGIKETGVKTIQVNDVFECNVLLKTINSKNVFKGNIDD